MNVKNASNLEIERFLCDHKHNTHTHTNNVFTWIHLDVNLNYDSPFPNIIFRTKQKKIREKIYRNAS